MTQRPLFHQVSIVGLGLIGGSLGMALRRRRLARRVIGFSRKEATLRRAKARGAIHDGCTELCPEWLGSSDLVVIATPPLSVPKIAREIAKLTRHRFVLTDVASTKGGIVSALERGLPGRISYVGSHPMAGSERSGIEAAGAKFFEGAPCIVTRTRRSSPQAVSRVSALWRAVGGRPVVLTAKEHDRLVSQISHLPHLSAAALTLVPESRAARLAAGGFTDSTRVALGDPQMWTEICLTNSREIARSLDRFIDQLQLLRKWVAGKDRTRLRRTLGEARRKRKSLGR